MSFFQPPKFLYQLAQLVCELIHGLLEAGQKIKGHHNGEAYSGNGGEDCLFRNRASLWQGLLIHNAQIGFLIACGLGSIFRHEAAALQQFKHSRINLIFRQVFARVGM
jgi:hypothetical protein